MTTLQVLADSVLASGESKKSGPIGLAVILLLCIACYFLFKSMSKHLRKVREEFPAPDEGDKAPPTSLVKHPPDDDQPAAPDDHGPPPVP